MLMTGAGNNKANISALDLDMGELSQDDIGEGLGVGGGLHDEESKQTNYFEALQFTDTKPKKSKTKPHGVSAEIEAAQPINFEDTM